MIKHKRVFKTAHVAPIGEFSRPMNLESMSKGRESTARVIRAAIAFYLIAGLLLCSTVGCGTTTQRRGTEQLLLSDAVDHAIAQVNFGPLSGRRVYLDSSYLQSVKGVGFVNAPYIISSLRQQLTAAGCMLQDNREKADVIVEARVGALGTDGHEVIYGLPKNNLLSSASAVLPGVPSIPVVPELSAARVDAQSGIAKLMVFAYDSETRRPIWQSGVARSESSSRNSWVLGAGPFQRGSVHEGTRFAGSRIKSLDDESRQAEGQEYFAEKHFPVGTVPIVRVAKSDESDDEQKSSVKKR